MQTGPGAISLSPTMSANMTLSFVYGWLDLDLKWVMKKELRKVPGLGIACEKVGHILVDRSRAGAAQKTIKKALENLDDGTGVLFFPEGTRQHGRKA